MRFDAQAPWQEQNEEKYWEIQSKSKVNRKPRVQVRQGGGQGTPEQFKNESSSTKAEEGGRSLQTLVTTHAISRDGYESIKTFTGARRWN